MQNFDKNMNYQTKKNRLQNEIKKVRKIELKKLCDKHTKNKNKISKLIRIHNIKDITEKW